MIARLRKVCQALDGEVPPWVGLLFVGVTCLPLLYWLAYQKGEAEGAVEQAECDRVCRANGASAGRILPPQWCDCVEVVSDGEDQPLIP